jgi:hypothetical protein
MSKNIRIKNITTELQTAANAARLAGDLITAVALEQSIVDLKEDLPKILPLISGLEFQTISPRDRGMDLAKWSLLKPKAIHASDLACVIDCGEQGRITIVGGAVLFNGSIGMQPMAAMLVADHARRYHAGGGTAFGSQEFLHNIAVANVAMKTAIDCGHVNQRSDADILQISRGWQPMADTIRAASPARPVARSGKAASIAIAPEPVA